MKHLFTFFLSTFALLAIITLSLPQPVFAAAENATSSKPYIAFLSVEKDLSVRVRAYNFPAGVYFTVRVGPFYTFFLDYVTTGSIYSGNGGTFDFTVNLPEKFKGASLVTVRLDGGGTYAYNAYRNVTQGTSGGTTPTPTPTATAAPSGACQVISRSPASVYTNADFDYIIEIKNTSSKAWETTAVDYKYISGSSIHKRALYDLNKTVQPGESIKLIIDMKVTATKGYTSATWALVEGNRTICSFPVYVTVR
jgi:hypothetical protein